jgi:pimeloyl-ACP methyl ester carboxylesterase
MHDTDLQLDDGRTPRVYDTGAGPELTVFWHHGTPNIGPPPAPLRPASERLGIRWVSYDRPGYGGSTPQAGRPVSSAVTYVAAVADALAIDSFAHVAPWGFEPSQVDTPVLFLHGGLDRVVPPAHSQWLDEQCPVSERRFFPDEGHVSILTRAEDALRWLVEHA